jgi:hypothetical protein
MKIIELDKAGARKPFWKFFLPSVLVCFSACIISNAQTISSGGSMVVGSGVVVNSNYDVSLQGGGTLTVLGTLILKNNLVNQKTELDALGSGTIEFSGTASQTISGPNVFTNLSIQNSAGVSLTGASDNEVNGTLTLTNGLLTLGSRNLLLGQGSAIAGTPSSSSMVVADGTGELRKSFSAPSSFTFPVGDATGTPEYSPVTLNFTAGTFGTGNYAGVKLTDAKYSNDSINGNYLTRYWNLSQSGITGFNCNATYKYLPSDVNGIESSIYCLKVNPSPWVTYSATNAVTHEMMASGLSNFSTFTGGGGGMDVSLTAFLEGPYTSGAMSTSLNSGGLIPHTQPYNTSPWNYNGPESVPSASPIPAGVVDWVLVELRQAGTPAGATSSTILKKRAAFIKSDGTIVDVDGVSPIRFYNAALTTNLYPVLRHRNHLAIMANNSVNKDISGVFNYNFSTSATQVYPGTGLNHKQIATGVWALYRGDSDQTDTGVSTLDFTQWQQSFGSINVYNPNDFDLDKNVNGFDFTYWATGFGAVRQIP